MKKTRFITGGRGRRFDLEIREAGRCISSGGLVVFPTETVYGLGTNALSAEAVSGIFRVKMRPADNPLIVHVGTEADVDRLVTHIPRIAVSLMKRFWPGPLTLVMRRSRIIPDNVTAGLDTVSVRMPSNRIALKLIAEAGVPVAAPSANISGRPSITNASQAVKELNGLVDYIVDGGQAKFGLESTVLDVTKEVPVILRPGAVTLEQLRRHIGNVRVHRAAISPSDIAGNPPSPGMKHRHYAPVNAFLFLVENKGEGHEIDEDIQERVRSFEMRGLRVAAMVSDECEVRAWKVARLGSRHDLRKVARNLFRTIRQLDEEGADVIVAEGFDSRGIGMALMNRLRRASLPMPDDDAFQGRK